MAGKHNYLKVATPLLLFTVILFDFPYKAESQKVERVYLSKEDTTRDMYLLVSPPKAVNTTGFMFLIPGMFEKPHDVLIQTKLPQYAAKKGIMTIIPVFAGGISSFAIDDSTQSSLKKMIEHCMRAYDLDNLTFYIGGFSTGGTCAIKYTELAVKDNYPVKPAAVFAIDPPLDYERFYRSALRNLRLMRGIYANPELAYMVKRIERKFGGTPRTALANYYKYSPYSMGDTTQSAVKLLRFTSLLIYAEPDIQWWLTNRAFDYTNINSIDDAAMINELHLLGNRQARFIVTHNKGYRMPDKIRHPHSWSILDPQALISWFNTIHEKAVK